ncbi:MAG: hypothetical protein AAF581_07685 [Planctomycetota bacterium]
MPEVLDEPEHGNVAIAFVDDEGRPAAVTQSLEREFASAVAIHEITSIEEARTALPQLAASSQRVILVLDLMFPQEGGDSPDFGLDFLEEVRSGDLGLAPDVPVLVYSNASPAYGARASRLGASSYVGKPETRRVRNELATMVRAGLAQRSFLCEVLATHPNDGTVSVRLTMGVDQYLDLVLKREFCPDGVAVGSAFELVFERKDRERRIHTRFVGDDEDALGQLLRELERD